MHEQSPTPDWDYVIDQVLPRLGMWTGTKTFVRAVSFLQGFDLATGGRLNPLLQAWAQNEFGAGRPELGWPTLLVYLTIDRPADDDLWPRGSGERLTPEEDRAALELLEQAVRHVRPHLS